MSRQDWVGAALGVGAICVTIAVSSGATHARIDDMRTDFNAHVQDMRADLREMRTAIDSLRGDVASLRGDVDGMRGNVDSMRSDIDSMRTDIDSMRTDMDRLNGLVLEHTTGHSHDAGNL